MTDLQSWRRTSIRERIAFYRRAHEGYNVSGKRSVRLPDGTVAFSPILPPVGSRVARRRMRSIVQHAAMGPHAAGAALPALRVPHVATIAVTYACQCDCRHCSVVRPGGDPTSLSVSELHDTVRQAIALGATSIVFTGGEPLLHLDIEGLVAAVDRSRAVCTIFTNGELLDAAAVSRLVRAGVFGIFVSLDYATASAHDGNRSRRGLFDRALAGIRACRDANLPVGISTYVTREKLDAGELDALMELGRRLEVLEVFVFDVTPAGRLVGRDECVLGDADISALRDWRGRYQLRPDYPRIVHQAMFATMAYPCVAEGCPAASVQLHVRANGDVTPCDFTPRVFGNVRQRPLRDIWLEMSGSPLYRFPSPRCRLALPEFRAQLAALSG